MPDLSIVQAPKISISTPSTLTPSVSVGTTSPSFLTQGSTPDLSLKSITAPTMNITGTVSNVSNLNLSGIGQQIGVPTSIGQAAAGFGIPGSLPPVGQALNTLGFNASMPQLNLSLTGLQFPKLPEFPGIDMAGINLGAGPKFIAEQIAKYKTIVPPFVPGLKINMGMAMAAISVLKAAMSANPSELVKHLLNSIVDDLKGQVAGQLQNAIDSTGVNNLQGQLSGVVDNAKGAFVDEFNRSNPPQTTTDEDGNVIEIPAPKPDLSGFPDVGNIAPKVGEGILKTTNIDTNQFSSTAGSNLKAFTFPPNG